MTEIKFPGKILLAFSILFLMAFKLAAESVIDVEVDRDQIQMNESFQVIFSVSEEPDETPDFSPLEENFDIINRMQSSQVSIINNDYQKSIQWKLTLMPKKTGELEIPSISFDTVKSAPKKVTILKTDETADNQGDLFIEAEVTPKTAYVQAELIYTLRVLSRYRMSGSLLSEPAPENALVTRLGDDRNYTTSRDGKGYQVIERRYAIFPQSSGELKIAPLQLDAEVMSPGSSQSRFGRYTSQMKRLSSPEFSIQVNPAPAEFTGKHWLPAENFNLEQRWSADFNQIKAGDPITRTILMSGKGVPSSQLPEVDMGLAVDENGRVNETAIKFYSDQPSKNEKQTSGGISSYREEKFALIATKPGKYTLPAIEIPWWNAETNQMEIARLAETHITVLPAAIGSGSDTTGLSESSQQNESNDSVAENTPAALATASDNLWPWVSLVLALGWASNVIWWLTRRGNQEQAAATAPSSEQGHSFSRKALQQACNENHGKNARIEILRWAQKKWPAANIYRLEEIKQFCGKDLADEIDNLNRSLYAADSTLWQGDNLWRVLAEEDKVRTANEPEKTSELSMLYKS